MTDEEMMDDLTTSYDQNKAWVLWWRQSDGSGTEVVRTYLDPDRAKEDAALVKDDIMKDWHLTEVPLVGDGPV